jgi:hypothetical protein
VKHLLPQLVDRARPSQRFWRHGATDGMPNQKMIWRAVESSERLGDAGVRMSASRVSVPRERAGSLCSQSPTAAMRHPFVDVAGPLGQRAEEAR